jgi:predicted DNA repair protein MutK
LSKLKIKGAIRTYFVLSAEIIVIILGTVKEASFETQVMVLSGMAALFTIGVYGFVAAIVKLDDLGLYLLRKSVSGSFNKLQRGLGRGLLIFAPFLMRMLTIVGTIAMFLVGGGILVHNFSWLHGIIHHSIAWLGSISALAISTPSSLLYNITAIGFDGLVGIISGGLVMLAIFITSSLLSLIKGNKRLNNLE